MEFNVYPEKLLKSSSCLAQRAQPASEVDDGGTLFLGGVTG